MLGERKRKASDNFKENILKISLRTLNSWWRVKYPTPWKCTPLWSSRRMLMDCENIEYFSVQNLILSNCISEFNVRNLKSSILPKLNCTCQSNLSIYIYIYLSIYVSIELSLELHNQLGKCLVQKHQHMSYKDINTHALWSQICRHVRNIRELHVRSMEDVLPYIPLNIFN